MGIAHDNWADIERSGGSTAPARTSLRATRDRGYPAAGAPPPGDSRNAPLAGSPTLTVGGSNLTDRRFITTGQPQVAGGTVYGAYNAPREWYATVGVKY